MPVAPRIAAIRAAQKETQGRRILAAAYRKSPLTFSIFSGWTWVSALLRAKVAAAEYALASIERSEGIGSIQRAP